MKSSKFSNVKKSDTELGFGEKSTNQIKRLVFKNGKFNVIRKGTVWQLYIDFIQMPLYKYILCILLFYLLTNLFFGSIYFSLGPENLNIDPTHSNFYKYIECVSFSVQTLATVGYGAMHPKAISTNVLSSIEALVGIILFAVITGLTYSRFSKPTNGYAFSTNAIIAPYQDISSFQIRVANKHNNNLIEIESTMMLAINVEENGVVKRVFVDLKLERNKIYYLPFSWTIVHPINEQSPLYGKTKQDLIDSNAEILIMLKAHDDAYANSIHGNSSYIAEEIIWNAKFAPSFEVNDKGVQEFDLGKLSSVILLENQLNG